MCFINDAKSYHLDWYHAMFFYHISGLGTRTEDSVEQRMFPKLSRNGATHAAEDITSILEELAEYIPFLDADVVSSKDLRYGPVAEMYLHPSGGHEICSARGGWMLDDLLEKKTGALVSYLTCLEINVLRGAMILGKYDNIFANQYEAKLCFMDSFSDVEKVVVNNFIFKIFHLSNMSPIFVKHLRHYIDTCFATFLLWLDLVSRHHCYNYAVVIKIN